MIKTERLLFFSSAIYKESLISIKYRQMFTYDETFLSYLSCLKKAGQNELIGFDRGVSSDIQRFCSLMWAISSTMSDNNQTDCDIRLYINIFAFLLIDHSKHKNDDFNDQKALGLANDIENRLIEIRKKIINFENQFGNKIIDKSIFNNLIVSIYSDIYSILDMTNNKQKGWNDNIFKLLDYFIEKNEIDFSKVAMSKHNVHLAHECYISYLIEKVWRRIRNNVIEHSDIRFDNEYKFSFAENNMFFVQKYLVSFLIYLVNLYKKAMNGINTTKFFIKQFPKLAVNKTQIESNSEISLVSKSGRTINFFNALTWLNSHNERGLSWSLFQAAIYFNDDETNDFMKYDKKLFSCLKE